MCPCLLGNLRLPLLIVPKKMTCLKTWTGLMDMSGLDQWSGFHSFGVGLGYVQRQIRLKVRRSVFDRESIISGYLRYLHISQSYKISKFTVVREIKIRGMLTLIPK